MTSSLDLVSFSAEYVNRFVLAAVRVMAAIGLNPLLGSPRVPSLARIGLALFTTMIIFPPGAPARSAVALSPTALAGELLVGLLAGFAVALLFGTVQYAAALINQNMGLGIQPTADAALDLGGGGLERFFYSFALVIFVQIDGHHLFLAGLRQLFDLVEVGTVNLNPAGAERLAAISAGLFSAATRMALPALAALLLADLGLAVLTRVAPAFNIFSLGLPLKMIVGLGALAFSLPLIAPRISSLVRGVPAAMFALAGGG